LRNSPRNAPQDGAILFRMAARSHAVVGSDSVYNSRSLQGDAGIHVVALDNADVPSVYLAVPRSAELGAGPSLVRRGARLYVPFAWIPDLVISPSLDPFLPEVGGMSSGGPIVRQGL